MVSRLRDIEFSKTRVKQLDFVPKEEIRILELFGGFRLSRIKWVGYNKLEILGTFSMGEGTNSLEELEAVFKAFLAIQGQTIYRLDYNFPGTDIWYVLPTSHKFFELQLSFFN